MNDKFDELHLIYKMIGNYGFCTVQSLLETYDNLQQELQRKDNIINAIKEELKQKQEYYRYRKDNRYRILLSKILDKIKELESK